jgi:Tol biopolymer transport system component
MYLGVEVDGQSHLWRQRYPDGVPEQITFGPSQEEGIALLPDGRSLITSLGVEQNTVWIHDSQGDRQLTSEGFASSPQLSTDGTRLYYLRRGGSMPSSYAFWEPSGAELWSLELASGRKEPRLTGTAVKEYAVSRDGENVAFTTERNGKSEIWLAPLDRRAPPRLLVDDADQPGFGAGGRLLFRSLGASSNYLAAVDVGSSTAPQRVLDAPILNFVSASPDGQSLVVFMKRGELAETVVIDLSDGREMPLGLGLFNARWSADGRHFYVPLEKREPGTVGRTLAIPLAPGTSPANSWRDRGGTSYAATASSWPDAQVLEHTVSFPGADGSSYVFMQPERKRNLFRIPLH